MFNDPGRFIEEKLQKKFLSINTIRDGIMAALLLSLQEAAQKTGKISNTETWHREKASEIRTKASEAFAAIAAPSEYPSLSQLKEVTASLKKSYEIDQGSEKNKNDFDHRCQAFFKKLEEEF